MIRKMFLIAALVAAAYRAHSLEIVVDNSDAGFAASASPGVVVLMYHGLDQYTGSSTYKPADFAAQMTYLASNGFQTITLDHLRSWIVTGAPALPPKPIVLTFDDNYITIFSVAFPELQSRGFVGYNFAHSNYVGVVTSYDHADWNEIRQMEAAGVIFTESHTVMHNNLAAMTQAQMDPELINSKSAIEAQIAGKAVRHLAYPYGGYDATVIARTQAAGYQTAVSTIAGINTRTTPLYELRRYAANPNTPMATFQANVNAGQTEVWTTSTATAGYYGSNYLTAPPSQRQAAGRWRFSVPTSGRYNVAARWPASPSHATDAPYVITHSEGQALLRMNQQAYGGQWMSLGNYWFDAGTEYNVALADNANGTLAADAIRVATATAVSDWNLYD